MTTLGWHVLASLGGYRTQGQSSDVSSDETRALETLGFGQTDQSGYLESLMREPALFGRPLPSGRYAVTRCFKGDPDSAGRTTLRFVSVLFEPEDWVNFGALALRSLASHADLWRPPPASNRPITAALTETSPSPSDRDALLGLADAWLGTRSTEVVALDDSPAHRDLVLALPAVLPKRQRASIRWGLRLLSTGAGAEVAVFDAAADLAGRRRIVHWDGGRALTHPYTLALSEIWADGGGFPERFRAGCKDANRLRLTDAERAQGRALSADPIVRDGMRHLPRPLWWHAGLALAAVAVVVASVAIFARTRAPDRRGERETDLSLRPRSVAPAAGGKQSEVLAALSEFDARESWSEAAMRAWIEKSGSLNVDGDAPIFDHLRDARASAMAAYRWLEEMQRWLAETSGRYEPCDATALPGSAEARAALASEIEAGRALLNDPRAFGFPALDREALSARVSCMARIALAGLMEGVGQVTRRLPPMRAMSIVGVPLGLRSLQDLARLPASVALDQIAWSLRRTLGESTLPPPPLNVALARAASAIRWYLDAMPVPTPPGPTPGISTLTFRGTLDQAKAYLQRRIAPDVGELLVLYVRLVNRDGTESLDDSTIEDGVSTLEAALREWSNDTITQLHRRVTEATSVASANPADEAAMLEALEGINEDQEDVTLLRAAADAGLALEPRVAELLQSMARAREALQDVLDALKEEEPDGSS